MQVLPTEIVAMMYNEERKELAEELEFVCGAHQRAIAHLAATKIQVKWQKKLSRYWERQAKMERTNRGIERQWFHSLVEGNKEVIKTKDLRIRIYRDKIAELEKTIEENVH